MNAEMIDATRQPIWSPWVVMGKPSDDDKLTGQFIRLGSCMTKNEAWDVARTEQENRTGVIAMTVRRDNEQF